MVLRVKIPLLMADSLTILKIYKWQGILGAK